MNELFKKLMEKKKANGEDKTSPVEKQATDAVLGDLTQFLNGHEGEKLKGLKKVTVASNDPEGLEAGLAKAKEMVASGKDGSEDDSDDSDDADMDEGSDPDSEDDHLESDDHEQDGEPEAHKVEGELQAHQDGDKDKMSQLEQQIAELKAQLSAAKGPMRI